MTQLIENKPRRRALIATLSHFYPLPFVRISNRNIPRLETDLTLAKSMSTAFLIATKTQIAGRCLSLIGAPTFGFEAKGVAFGFEEERDGS
jgi:hypothetical protein